METVRARKGHGYIPIARSIGMTGHAILRRVKNLTRIMFGEQDLR